ncbi:MAG: S41 family peptidase [Anaerolineae bacterium]|nr:S41 family peptidase [Anaerolineae bacterium]
MTIRPWRVLGVLGAVLAILMLGLLGGVLIDRVVLFHIAPPGGIPAEAVSEFRLMGEAWNTVHQAYVDREALDSQHLTYGAIAGMVDALGDTGHSRFLSPQMVEEQHSALQGEYEGIGAYIETKDGHVVIMAPMDGSPAQRAGLRPGNVVLKVDGQNVVNLGLDDVRGRILGPAGTQVTLTILDSGTGNTRDVTLERAKITVDNVTWTKLPGTSIAHVRISAFSKGSVQDLKDALTEIQAQEVTGLVLDLRSNPGGLLNEAVGVASQFLARGNVLLVKDAEGKTTPLPVQSGGLAVDIPIVVLVDRGTASAAEIVTGALQDAKRATVVGEATFGTGTVLREFPLSDGSVLLLAIQEWLTPDGRVIWHQGLAPDVSVALPVGVAPLVPLAERGLTIEQVRDSGDAQLLRALELLGCIASFQNNPIIPGFGSHTGRLPNEWSVLLSIWLKTKVKFPNTQLAATNKVSYDKNCSASLGSQRSHNELLHRRWCGACCG